MKKPLHLSQLFLLLFVLLVVLAGLQQASGQQKQKLPAKPGHNAVLRARVFVKARAINGQIYLRWAVDQPAAWKLANQYGYIVERYSILANGAFNPLKEKVLLTRAPLLPRPEAEWAPIAEQSNDAAIVAQGLFGQSFVVSGGGSGLASIVNQSNELQQRYTFSLLAADRDFDAAQMAGWGFIDKSARPKQKYLYRVFTAVPAAKAKIDTGGAFIGPDDEKPLPQPKDLYATFGDKAVMLSWNYRLLKDYYTTYYIERSDNGGDFKRLFNLPVANLNEKEGKAPSRLFYTDTLPQNNHTFAYRVKGITCFGEISPPSEPVSGKGRQLLAYVPNITKARFENENTVNIFWEIADESKTVVDHFELSQSANSKAGTYKTVLKDIPATQRQVTYSNLLPANYFTITAVDKQGSRRVSFPYLVQATDTIPPGPPTGLSATIDSLGHVFLKWKANTEPDLLGYNILKSNLKNEEPAVLNTKPWLGNQFNDSVNVKNLNPKVYYSVIALDKRYNRSKPSAYLEVAKPDLIPPTSPVFKNYEITADGKVRLYWVNSSSGDVAKTRLLRKKILNGEKTAAWAILKEFKNHTDTAFTDASVNADTTYSYSLMAIDSSNNQSGLATAITVKVVGSPVISAVKDLRATIDKEQHTIIVSWVFEHSNVVGYQVYKTVNKVPYTLWRVINAPLTHCIDGQLSPGNTYRYAVRAVLKNGKMSTWKEIAIDY